MMVLNNKVIKSVGERAEGANAVVTDAVMTSSTKVLQSFLKNQDQKNEQLIQKIALENSRLLEKMAKSILQSRVAPAAQTAQPNTATAQRTQIPEPTPEPRDESAPKPKPMNINPASPASVKRPKK